MQVTSILPEGSNVLPNGRVVTHVVVSNTVRFARDRYLDGAILAPGTYPLAKHRYVVRVYYTNPSGRSFGVPLTVSCCADLVRPWVHTDRAKWVRAQHDYASVATCVWVKVHIADGSIKLPN